MTEMIEEAIKYIRQQGSFHAEVAVILGSGLGNFTESLARPTRIPFTGIPGFPTSTVKGHAGEMIHGYLGDRPLLVNSGRVHFYEGYTLDQVIYPIQILHALGVEHLLITNAAGSIRKAHPPGELLLITKLLNLTGRSIYAGEEEPGSIFHEDTLSLVQKTAERAGVALRNGVYAGLNGPSYETPAEIRFLRLKGADAVGMSTVHESLAAHRLGMNVVALSCLTNYAAGILDQPLDHQEVIDTSLRVQNDFSRLVSEVVKTLAG
ncbi:MAG: purine-nucleoside phosphorylase [Candidatus Marinimicrobia bacterium]|nr:purine-nucleoside phosphorylase [Candidatus Neomarinimicrobiota bacterium]MCF7851470.1 purine-nucleoside phosphorylase [Candidatus Neomarinimicrobiota bacterium]MCF7904089.1 purine-nucleoside phosphorylase [Candidatus Neomarinimicrobiota bacterium]